MARQRRALELIRGATFEQELNFGMDLTDATVYFTVKRAFDSDTTDGNALIAKEFTDHSDAPGGKTVFRLESAETDLTPGDYICDFHVKSADTPADRVVAYEPVSLIIKPSVTLRS